MKCVFIYFYPFLEANHPVCPKNSDRKAKNRYIEFSIFRAHEKNTFLAITRAVIGIFQKFWHFWKLDEKTNVPDAFRFLLSSRESGQNSGRSPKLSTRSQKVKNSAPGHPLVVKIFEKKNYQNFRNIQKFFVWKYEGSISNHLGAINETVGGRYSIVVFSIE